MTQQTPHTIPHALAQAGARWGTRTAIVDGALRLTFAQLQQQVERAAGAIAAHGIEPGDRIAIWAPNRFEWIVACIAAQTVGALVVPLNTRLKGLEAQYILNKTRARLVFTVSRFLTIDYLELLRDLELPHVDRVITFDHAWQAFIDSVGDDDIAAACARRDHLDGDTPCDILFTSGTTGHPKGVVSTHGQSVQLFSSWSRCVGLQESDRYLIISPFFHVFGYKAGWLACLLTGATLYPQSVFTVSEVIGRIAAERITVLPGPPTIFQTLLAASAAAADLSSLRLAITGAASVPAALIERMRGELGISHVLTGYGLTEAGVVTLSAPLDSPQRIATTAGKPIPGIEVQCVDAAGAVVPHGEQGEIWVRGYNVMHGYFEDPAATAQAIDAAGWLHTGDVGRFVDDGYLQITDRLKDMYISGGFNCYPAEIERMLCAHPAVEQAAVIGVPDERMGEVGKAFIVPRTGAALSEQEILAWSKGHMADYKAPRYAEIVAALPLNAAGKVQKSLLLERRP